MVRDSLRIDAAGGIDRAHIRQQGPEFVQRTEVRRRPPQNIDKGLLGVFPPIEGAEQDRALDLALDHTVACGVTGELLLKLSQP